MGDRFEEEKVQVRLVLGAVVQGVQHFGSTSVPGLRAKPTVDLLLGTHRWPWRETDDRALAELGYTFYKAPNERWRVYLKPWQDVRRGYHLHVVEFDSGHWHDHLCSATICAHILKKPSGTEALNRS